MIFPSGSWWEKTEGRFRKRAVSYPQFRFLVQRNIRQNHLLVTTLLRTPDSEWDKNLYKGNLVFLSKGVKVLEIAVGAFFAPTKGSPYQESAKGAGGKGARVINCHNFFFTPDRETRRIDHTTTEGTAERKMRQFATPAPFTPAPFRAFLDRRKGLVYSRRKWLPRPPPLPKFPVHTPGPSPPPLKILEDLAPPQHLDFHRCNPPPPPRRTLGLHWCKGSGVGGGGAEAPFTAKTSPFFGENAFISK